MEWIIPTAKQDAVFFGSVFVIGILMAVFFGNFSGCEPSVTVPITFEQSNYVLIRWRGAHKQAPTEDVQTGDYYYNKTDECLYYWNKGEWHKL